MRILSLFDGISGAQVAINNLGIKDYTYYASEVDKYAIEITQNNYPETIQIGDVSNINGADYKDIDLLIGGSPCQDLSIAKRNRTGLSGQRSGLFWEYVRILKECKPRYFVLENVVSMRDEDKGIISDALNCEPVKINSALLTAQMRKRYYWSNIYYYEGLLGQMVSAIPQPEDKGIFLKDILLDDAFTKDMKSYVITATYSRACIPDYEKGQSQLVFIGNIGDSNSQGNRVYNIMGKSVSLSSNGGGLGAKTGLYKMGTPTEAYGRGGNSKEHKTMVDKIGKITGKARKLHPVECERLQGFPDNYTDCVSNTQRYKGLGNSFTVPVIEHILSFMKE